ncbi:hypothetical protein QQF64_035967 [Cirrhinus molitorella]|uniref:Uncharacterized protein n=1 Tax=Cirrhinus molitorella TaxID=172907 RepID=A0ABR3NH96_9TELE
MRLLIGKMSPRHRPLIANALRPTFGRCSRKCRLLCVGEGALLRTFYDSVVASAILYGVVCWSSSITERERKKLDKVIKRSSFVLGCRLDSVREVGARRVLKKLTSMLDHDSHPLRDILLVLESSFSRRLLHPQCVKERFRRSFLPAAVRLYNEHC